MGNGFIGILGNLINGEIILLKSIDEVSYHYFTGKDVSVTPVDDYYEVQYKKDKHVEDGHVPIYNQIHIRAKV